MKGEELYFNVINSSKLKEKKTDCLIHIYNAVDEPLDTN